MIPNISIDISEVLDEFVINQSQAEEMVDSIIKRLTYRFYETWSVTAGNSLKSSRFQYISALQVLDEGKMKGAVLLHGTLPNMVESGQSAFDMKEGFARSKKRKMKKDGGWYLTIPFRFSGSGSLGESEVFSGKLPSQIQEVVASKLPQKTQFKGTIKLGEQLSRFDIPEKYREPAKRAAVSSLATGRTFEEYIHKTSIYEGIQRSEKLYQNATQSMFNSFRRVSDKSDPSAFINPGILARNLAEKALSGFNVDHETNMEVDKYLSSLGF